MSHRVTRNTDSTNVPMEGRKSGSLMILSEFGRQIFFLFREINHLEIKFFCKKYVSDMLYTSSNCL